MKLKAPKEEKCLGCQKLFTVTYTNQLYCTKLCSDATRSQRQKDAMKSVREQVELYLAGRLTMMQFIRSKPSKYHLQRFRSLIANPKR